MAIKVKLSKKNLTKINAMMQINALFDSSDQILTYDCILIMNRENETNSITMSNLLLWFP